MSNRSPATITTKEKSSVIPMRSPLIQRKCACGNSAGMAGECSDCQKKSLVQGKSIDQDNTSEVPSIAHEFPQAKLTVGKPSEEAKQLMSIPKTVEHDKHLINGKDQFSRNTHDPFFISSEQLPPGEEDMSEDYLDEFLPNELISEIPEEEPLFKSFQILAGSGTCNNGGGSSTCNLSTGMYEITSNTNNCCTTDCTKQHEMQHVIDHTKWGCCKKLSSELVNNANPSGVRLAYKRWFDIVAPITECHAYKNDVKCIKAMEKAKGCTGQGVRSDCCADIADYKTRYSSLAEEYCSKAPTTVPPCPLVI
jgi:hypothetical protein